MTVQASIYLIIFILLLCGLLFLCKCNPFARKSTISLSKQVLSDKKKHVDERFAKLTLQERIMTAVSSTVTVSGGRIELFWAFSAGCALAGFAGGLLLFDSVFLAVITAVVLAPAPYILYRVKTRWYQRSQNELLENTMTIITNSYIGSGDIITAVNENLSKLDIRTPFAEFVTDVTLIDSNIKRALRRLELKINNKYFSEWIDILVLSYEQSGDMRFILPSVVEAMNDTKKLQIKANTVMKSIWKEYFMSIALAFSIIPILRWSNAVWFEILTGTVIGKLLITLMLVMTLVSAFLVLKINKPLYPN